MSIRRSKKAKQAREKEAERLDLEAIRRSLAEPGEPIPWSKVKKELNLCGEV